MMRAFLAGIALASSLAFPALAADEECHGIFSQDTGFAAAEVGPGTARLNFLDSPRANSTQAQAFLVPGDVVVISRLAGGYGCASYLNTRGQATTGWLPMDALRPVLEQRKVAPARWVGTWRGNRGLDQEVRIAGDDTGPLHITGSASWGRMDPDRVSRGAVNAGSLQADARPHGNALSLAEGDDELECHARMLLLGPYLVVQDNLRCGGMNVTFSGLYRRAS